jgi:E3 ubiquitin-protein ligase RNF14
VVPLEEDSHDTEDWNKAHGDHLHGTDDATDNYPSVSLSMLPPLLLEIILPSVYPIYIPPEIISLYATHGWLGKRIGPLRQHLLDTWQAGEGVLYNWIELIRSGEFLDTLGLLGRSSGKDILK